MKLEFLVEEENNTRLILIFAGWGSDARIATGIELPGWDVAVAHDFSELSLDTSFLSRYYTVYLFAWSLGVFAASRVLPGERITSAFAINGSITPVDDSFGIPTAIYDGTIENLNLKNLRKFRVRMAGSQAQFRDLSVKIGGENEYDIENLRHQLEVIKIASSESPLDRLPWVRTYIGMQDRIFPPENMRNAWEKDKEVEVIMLDKPHYIELGEIVESVISNPEKVSKHFAKAAISYDTNAIAQYSAIIKLTGYLKDLQPRPGGSILEIGCGTGLFTREYEKVLRPTQATFVDITETSKFGIAESEEYFVEDAEQWILRQNQEWDAILSSSAIQWFADIPRFLHECHRCLKRGGILAISTFIPGNMEELDALRPSPLIYPKPQMLRECLDREFSEAQVIEDCIRVEFKSLREMLMHLKHTGVAGSAPSTGLSIQSMSHLRSLTYRPVYLLARKP